MNKEKQKNPEKKLVPEQLTGDETGACEMVKEPSVKEAKELFRQAKERYQDLNNWDKYSGPLSGKFQLCDSNGKEVVRKPQKGDMIKIALPAPGPASGEGFDWVEIEAVEEFNDEEADVETFGFRARPAPSPETSSDKVAHFYSDITSSTFILKREGNKISAAEVGKNVVINNEDVNLVDKVRNTVVGGTAKAGVAKLQWQSLMKGILNKKSESGECGE